MSGTGVVVIRAANRWDEVRMADHQLARALSRHAPVLYVDPCSAALTRYRAAGAGAVGSGLGRLTRVTDGVVRLCPEGLPGIRHPAVLQLNRRLVAGQIRRALRRLGVWAEVLLEGNVLTPTLDLVPVSRRVYWAQDDVVGMAPLIGVSEATLAATDSAMTAAADLVIAANPAVAEAHRGLGPPVGLIPFGCDADLFASAADAEPAPLGHPGPVAVLMGTLNERIDPDLLDAVADTGLTLLLVGPRGAGFDAARFERLVARSNVVWVGPRDFTELPAYLAAADVGLVPYTRSRFNLGSFPLKTLEYLAAGLPVVATGLPAIGWLDTDQIRVADDPQAFAARVMEAAHSSSDTDRAAHRKFALDHTWPRRAAAFADALGLPRRVPVE